MESEKKKRQRCSNFNSEEIINLVVCVVKYKDILESKRTDAYSWKEKKAVWNTITTEFNSCTPNDTRDSKTLKSKYESMKKNIRKKCAEDKKQKCMGGPYKKTDFEDYEKLLMGEIDCKAVGYEAAGSDTESEMQVITDKVIVNLEEPDSSSDSVIVDSDNEISITCTKPSALDENIHVESNATQSTQYGNSGENAGLPNTKKWSSTLKSAPNSKLKYFKRRCCNLNNCNSDKLEKITQSKLKLIKKKENYLEEEEKRKIALFNKKLEYLEKKNKREEEEHNLKMAVLKLGLKK